MEMTSLRQLHRSMIAFGSDMQQFLGENRCGELQLPVLQAGHAFRAHAYGPRQGPRVLLVRCPYRLSNSGLFG